MFADREFEVCKIIHLWSITWLIIACQVWWFSTRRYDGVGTAWWYLFQGLALQLSAGAQLMFRQRLQFDPHLAIQLDFSSTIISEESMSFLSRTTRCCFPFFLIWLTQTVVKILLHANVPGHYEFSRYNTCKFRIKLQTTEQGFYLYIHRLCDIGKATPDLNNHLHQLMIWSKYTLTMAKILKLLYTIMSELELQWLSIRNKRARTGTILEPLTKVCGCVEICCCDLCIVFRSSSTTSFLFQRPSGF